MQLLTAKIIHFKSNFFSFSKLSIFRQPPLPFQKSISDKISNKNLRTRTTFTLRNQTSRHENLQSTANHNKLSLYLKTNHQNELILMNVWSSDHFPLCKSVLSAYLVKMKIVHCYKTPNWFKILQKDRSKLTPLINLPQKNPISNFHHFPPQKTFSSSPEGKKKYRKMEKL